MSEMHINGLFSPHDGILSVGPEQSAGQVIALMAEKNVSSVLVVRPSDQGLLGIVTERDILRKVALPRLDPDQIPVEQIMTPDLVSCPADSPVSEAQALMVARNIRHLPVVEDGRVVGILSSRDVLMHQLSSVQGIGQSLTRIVEQFRSVFPTMIDQEAPAA